MSNGIQSVNRALDIVEEIVRRSQPAGVCDLARTLGLKVQTLHNLVRTLASRGYLAQDAGTRAYLPGARLLETAGRVLRGVDLPRLAAPFMEGLAAELGETVLLATMHGSDIVWAAHALGTRTVIANLDHPGRRDAYNAATGRVLLAYAAPDVVKEYVRSNPPSRSVSEHIRTRRDLNAELKAVRARGHAIIERRDPDTISAVGVPVSDAVGAVPAALGISMPSSRFRAPHRRAVTHGLLKAASGLSSALGSTVDAWT